ncbi:MAG TPA: sigma-70 family RNA polymerase sigma factor [Candidatus Limnocylindrales bacterium]|nr:sigma-70 family RNA polymerase sigma factor [Candidatus Limnocylindrales bacterium]
MHDPALDRTVAQARAGDRAALAALYDLFASRVYRFALVRVRSSADAEDLLQRIFVKVIEGLPRYEERGLPFAAWLFRIARNTVIDHERTLHEHASLDDIAQRVDDRAGPEALADAAFERETIRTALEQLTPEQRDVIAYRFFAGLSPAEIGLLMDRREGAIRALQFRAIQTLRDNLGRDAAAMSSGMIA